MAAIRAGVVTTSTKDALQAAEQAVDGSRLELREMEAYRPETFLPRARDLWKQAVQRLESEIDNIPVARRALSELLGGEITILEDGNQIVAEMAAGGITSRCEITMVAGGRFGRYLMTPTKFRIPLTTLRRRGL